MLILSSIIWETDIKSLDKNEVENLEGMGEAAVHGANSLHTKDDNIMSVMNGWIP